MFRTKSGFTQLGKCHLFLVMLSFFMSELFVERSMNVLTGLNFG